jgi:uncharacterized protein YbdZ (MbtH family)
MKNQIHWVMLNEVSNITNNDQSHNSNIRYIAENWANMDPWKYHRLHHVSKWSKHSLSTG